MQEELKAFSPIESIEDGSFFVSKEIKSVITRGLRAARHHGLLVLDAEHGVGATIALEVLKQYARTDPDVILADISPYARMSQTMLWHEVLMELGERPAWRWSDWKDAKGNVHQGRNKQLQYKLAEFYTQGKSVLVCVDNALSLPNCIWEMLRVMASVRTKGRAYGPGVVLVANLKDKIARFKPEDIVAESQAPNMARRVSFKLAGLGVDEVSDYVAFQGARDGLQFHPGFLTRLTQALQNAYLVDNGLSRFPGYINAVALDLAEEFHHLGKPITAGAGVTGVTGGPGVTGRRSIPPRAKSKVPANA